MSAISSKFQLIFFRVNNAFANEVAMQTIIKTTQKEIKIFRDFAVKTHKLTESIKQFLNNRIYLSDSEYIVFKIILVSSSVLIIIEIQISFYLSQSLYYGSEIEKNLLLKK